MKLSGEKRRMLEMKLAINLEQLAADILRISEDMKILGGENIQRGENLAFAAEEIHKWAEDWWYKKEIK